MNAPETHSSEDHGELVAPPPGQLTQSLPAFAGFTVPAAKLHSIPLAPEFSDLIESARSENHVETPFPKYFNPLFRKQGVVNKHTINALASVGDSLNNLAREIEERDRAIEKLTSHFNSYTDYAHRGQVTLVQFVEQLAAQTHEITSRIQKTLEQEAEHSRISGEQITGQIAAVAGDLRARLDQEAERWHISSSSVIATIRAAERRASELGKQQGELSRALDTTREGLTKLAAEVATRHAESSDQNQATREAVNRRLDDLGSTCAANHEEARKQTATQAERLCALEQRMDLLETSMRDEMRMITERLAQTDGRITAQLAVSAESAETTNVKFSALEDLLHSNSAATESQLKAIGEREESVVTHARALQGEQRTLATEFERVRTGLLDLTIAHQAIAKQSEETAIMLRGIKASMDAFLASTPGDSGAALMGESSANATGATAETQTATVAAQTALSDAFYVAFQARFRGPLKLIRERLSVYIPIIMEARERTNLYPPVRTSSATDLGDLPPPADGVLDLGCGRGEWLELLAENGVPALGVEKNQFFVDMCRKKNSTVAPGDIMAFLRAAPSESVAAVTSFHVIEHLPIPCFEEMIRHVFRILRRGGVVILETPSPTNIITSSFNFWSDPTHLRPVHPDFGKLLLETTGFAPVNLQFLNPVDASAHVGSADDPLAQRFNQLCYGPQDFAFIGIKP